MGLSAPRLEYLSLEYCGLTDKTAEYLSMLTIRSPSLFKLDLEHNQIGDHGAAALARSLGSLRSLDLKDNRITDLGK